MNIENMREQIKAKKVEIEKLNKEISELEEKVEIVTSIEGVLDFLGNLSDEFKYKEEIEDYLDTENKIRKVEKVKKYLCNLLNIEDK